MIKDQKMNMFDQADSNPFITSVFMGQMVRKMMAPVLGEKEKS